MQGPSQRRRPPSPASEEQQRQDLQAFLAAFGFGWRGYRRRYRRVRSRIYGCMAELQLTDLDSYRQRILEDAAERRRLHALIGISVSRFFRDRVDWDLLGRHVLTPWLSQTGIRRAWSLGCASGEEPYTLRMLWLELAGEAAASSPSLEILATEARHDLLARAEAAGYPLTARRHLSPERLARFCRIDGDTLILKDTVRAGVRFAAHDYLLDPWPQGFDLILARNGPFTYRMLEDRTRLLQRIADALRPGGHLFVGSNDDLPADVTAHFRRVGRSLWTLATAGP